MEKHPAYYQCIKVFKFLSHSGEKQPIVCVDIVGILMWFTQIHERRVKASVRSQFVAMVQSAIESGYYRIPDFP